jgi:hypothetical protein
MFILSFLVCELIKRSIVECCDVMNWVMGSLWSILDGRASMTKWNYGWRIVRWEQRTRIRYDVIPDINKIESGLSP